MKDKSFIGLFISPNISLYLAYKKKIIIIITFLIPARRSSQALMVIGPRNSRQQWFINIGV